MSSNDTDDFIAIFAAAAVAVAAMFLVVPVAIVAGCFLAYKLFSLFRNSEKAKERRAQAATHALYEQARALSGDGVLSADAFLDRFIERLRGKPIPHSQVSGAFCGAIHTYYENEVGLPAKVPEPPAVCGGIDGARYRDTLTALLNRPALRPPLHTLFEVFEACLLTVTEALPKRLRRDHEDDDDALFHTSLLYQLEDVGAVVTAFVLTFYDEDLVAAGYFKPIRDTLEENLHAMSGIPLTPRTRNSPDLVMPNDHTGTPEEIVLGYLRGTGFEQMFFAEVPVPLSEQTRFEHQWVVAGTGHGKTQTLQYMLGHDLERVKCGEASVVVVDSQGDLIRNISRLAVFAEGGDLHDRLCIIDPTDIEFPVALNLFDVNMERINRYSPLDRERLVNGVLELYDFVLGSLLGAGMTQKQTVVFRYITRLLIHIPDANIQTLRELLEPGGYEKYERHIKKLEGTARAFFETEFMSREFEDTKRQVVRRLWGILENQTFERMFSHPRNKLDLFSEMNAGKVILINTAKSLLKQNGTEIFGRFFIAMIAQAAQERETLPPARRLPTFVYVDEISDYTGSGDINLSVILEQARKQKVGLLIFHQFIGQLPNRIQESLAANTAIKFAGGVSYQDARAFARMMRCDPAFIERQPKGHFAAHVRGATDGALQVRVPFGVLESRDRMTNDQRQAVIARNRERYAVPIAEVRQSIGAQLPGARDITVEAETTNATPDW